MKLKLFMLLILLLSLPVLAGVHGVVISLPQGTPLRKQANMKDNPEIYQTQIWLKGTFATYMGTHGITGKRFSNSAS